MGCVSKLKQAVNIEFEGAGRRIWFEAKSEVDLPIDLDFGATSFRVFLLGVCCSETIPLDCNTIFCANALRQVHRGVRLPVNKPGCCQCRSSSCFITPGPCVSLHHGRKNSPESKPRALKCGSQQLGNAVILVWNLDICQSRRCSTYYLNPNSRHQLIRTCYVIMYCIFRCRQMEGVLHP